MLEVIVCGVVVCLIAKLIYWPLPTVRLWFRQRCEFSRYRKAILARENRYDLWGPADFRSCSNCDLSMKDSIRLYNLAQSIKKE